MVFQKESGMTSTEAGAPRIVVGYDASPSSTKAIEWAARQAELTGSNVEVITAWEWPTTYGAPMALPEGFDPASDARKVVEEAGRLVTSEHPGVQVRLITTEGHAAPVLVEASKGASLLVVGARGHGEFIGMVLGSVSEHCVTNAHCPVLVLRNV
jgi:nucleotide-binding universal stress UspA family protein